MKRNKLWRAVGLAMSLSAAIPVASAVEWGVGAGISGGEEGSTIYVPIRAGNYRIEPELSFYQSTDENTYPVSPNNNRESESNWTSLGVGVFRRMPLNASLEAYVGGRLGYTRSERSSTYPNAPTNGYTDDSSGYFVGPTVGAEYFFARQFSIGLDVSLIYSATSGDYTPNSGTGRNSWDDTDLYTETRAALRFYF